MEFQQSPEAEEQQNEQDQNHNGFSFGYTAAFDRRTTDRYRSTYYYLRR
jgi:hypothetical protein